MISIFLGFRFAYAGFVCGGTTSRVLPAAWLAQEGPNSGFRQLAGSFRQTIFLGIQIFDLSYRRKGDFNDIAVGTFHLDARRGQRLRGFHAAHNATNAPAIEGRDLDVVFAV